MTHVSESQGRMAQCAALIIVSTFLTSGLVAAQPRNGANAEFVPARKYETRAQCEADPDKSRSCCDFTERLRYASRRHDGKLISELGAEMPTRLICHDPDFER